MDPINVKDFLLESDDPIDNIIGTYDGTFSVNAATGSPNPDITTVNIKTGITSTCFFQGIFSIDGGNTWQDFNANLSTTRGGNIVVQTVTVVGESVADGSISISCLNYYDYTNSVGTAYTVLWKLVLFARPNQPALDLQPVGADLSFNTDLNYQKIASDTYQTLSAPGPGITSVATFPHNLGYKPKFRIFLDQSTDTLNLNSNNLYDIQTMSAGVIMYYAKVDTENVYVYAYNGYSPTTYTARIYARIYYDS